MRRQGVVLMMAFLLLIVEAARGEVLYTVTDLGTLGGAESQARAPQAAEAAQAVDGGPAGRALRQIQGPLADPGRDRERAVFRALRTKNSVQIPAGV